MYTRDRLRQSSTVLLRDVIWGTNLLERNVKKYKFSGIFPLIFGESRKVKKLTFSGSSTSPVKRFFRQIDEIRISWGEKFFSFGIPSEKAEMTSLVVPGTYL